LVSHLTRPNPPLPEEPGPCSPKNPLQRMGSLLSREIGVSTKQEITDELEL
jgi:hypothetical protein